VTSASAAAATANLRNLPTLSLHSGQPHRDLGSKFARAALQPKSRAGQEKGEERIGEYGQVLRTRRRFSLQPEGTRAFSAAGVVTRRS
jgi:hypothetical protein